MNYSFKKGLVKGLISLLAIGGALAVFAGLSDITLWSLLEQYVRPVLGALTVGGTITVVVNYIKIKYGN